MQVEEIFIEDNFFMDAGEPYTESMNFMDFCLGYGSIKEIENDVMSDGPQKRTNLVFHIIKHLDTFSSAVFAVSIEGSQKFNRKAFLKIHVKGSYVASIPTGGFFADALQRFYMEHIYKEARNAGEEYIKFVYGEMQGCIGIAVQN